MIKRFYKLIQSIFIKKKENGLLMWSGFHNPETGETKLQYEIYQYEGETVRSPLITKPEDI